MEMVRASLKKKSLNILLTKYTQEARTMLPAGSIVRALYHML